MISVVVYGPYVTLINLEHTLYTEAAARNQLNGFENNIKSQGSANAHIKKDKHKSESYTSQPTPLHDDQTALPKAVTYQHSTDG